MAIQQQMSHHAPGKEAANAAAIAGHGALELRRMADDAGYNHARPVRRFRRRPAHRPARGRTRDRLHVLLAAGTALGGWELQGKNRVSGGRVIRRVCDFFDVVKNGGCKQNSYDNKLVINSKKSHTLSGEFASLRDSKLLVEGSLLFP